MKKILLTVSSFLLLLLLHQSVSWASINQFNGTWVNMNSNTRGITKMEISHQGSAIKLHAWGKCHPKDCDWGTVPAFLFAPNVSADMMQTGKAMSAMFKTSFSQTLVIVKPAGKNRLKAETFTRFTDGSNRSNYTSSETFQRSLQLVPGVITPVNFSPDLVIDDIWLNKNCQVVVRVKNNGPGKIADEVWTVHEPKSAGIYLLKNGQNWGGATIWKFDPSKSLQSPGGTAVYTSNLQISGKSVITAKIDIWDKVKEGQENNNKKTETLLCKPGMLFQKP